MYSMHTTVTMTINVHNKQPHPITSLQKCTCTFIKTWTLAIKNSVVKIHVTNNQINVCCYGYNIWLQY